MERQCDPTILCLTNLSLRYKGSREIIWNMLILRFFKPVLKTLEDTMKTLANQDTNADPT